MIKTNLFIGGPWDGKVVSTPEHCYRYSVHKPTEDLLNARPGETTVDYRPERVDNLLVWCAPDLTREQMLIRLLENYRPLGTGRV